MAKKNPGTEGRDLTEDQRGRFKEKQNRYECPTKMRLEDVESPNNKHGDDDRESTPSHSIER